MKKLIIILKGTNKFSNSPKIGQFLRVPGFEDPIWQGKLLTLEEFNDVAESVIDKQKSMALNAGHVVSVRLIDDIPAEEVGDLLGADYIPGDNTEEEVQAILEEIREKFYTGGSRFDWNNLSPHHRGNFIKKAFAQAVGENEANEPGEPIVTAEIPEAPDEIEEVEGVEKIEVETNENVEVGDPVPYDRIHSGRGKYDIFDKDGVKLQDNITKEEAVALIPERPEIKIERNKL